MDDHLQALQGCANCHSQTRAEQRNERDGQQRCEPVDALRLRPTEDIAEQQDQHPQEKADRKTREYLADDQRGAWRGRKQQLLDRLALPLTRRGETAVNQPADGEQEEDSWQDAVLEEFNIAMA